MILRFFYGVFLYLFVEFALLGIGFKIDRRENSRSTSKCTQEFCHFDLSSTPGH